MNVSKYFLLRVWIVFCLFSSPLLQADTTKTYDREYSLQDIEERLDRIEASIDNFKFGSQKTTQPDTAFLPTNSLKEVSVSKILDQSGQRIFLKRKFHPHQLKKENLKVSTFFHFWGYNHPPI